MHTDLLPEKKKEYHCVFPCTNAEMGCVRTAEHCIPYWANSSILVPPPPSPLFNIYEFTSLPNTWQPKHSVLRTVQWKMKWVLPSVEYLVTSVSGPLGKMGRKGKGEKEGEKERRETSANYNVQQAKLQCRLSQYALKNDGAPALYREGVKNSPCQERDIIY